jgi:endonuclease/exonuclease/phosphatase family metal-dependent hydrolase
MLISILSYNLLYHQALPEVELMANEYNPDIICLQEVSADEISSQPLLINNHYQLASFSNSFINHGKIFGVATFFNQKTTHLVRYENNKIPHTLYDWFRFFINIFKRKIIRRGVLKTTFQIKKSKEKITVINIHLTAEATNGARIKQLNEILKQTLKNKYPTILVGDFNYVPYRRKRLENILKNYGFKEATDKIDYTFSPLKNTYFYGLIAKIFIKLLGFFNPRYKLDFIFYKKLKLKEVKRIASKISDHYPVLAIFEI